jgi:magnesium-transporting ATPase (P-type)
MGKKKHDQDSSHVQLQQLPWHSKKVDDLTSSWGTSLDTGLTDDEAARRLQTYGYNELPSDSSPKWVKVLLRQFLDAMNWIFMAMGIVAMVLEDFITGSLLMTLAIGNLLLSFSQEYSAEKTLAALRNLSSSTAQVIRNGNEMSIFSRELVPGDLLLVKEGDSVPADARLFYVSSLEVDESLLTGESVPVEKKLVVSDNEGT